VALISSHFYQLPKKLAGFAPDNQFADDSEPPFPATTDLIFVVQPGMI
jgi:hypothetical protein